MNVSYVVLYVNDAEVCRRFWVEQVIRDLVADRTTWATRAAAGQAFARTYHDGRYSAAVLAKWMGVPVNQS